MAPKGIDKKVGETLAKIRCDLSLTQEQISNASGLPQERISRIERATRSIWVRDVVAYCKAMGYEIRFVPKKRN